MAINNAVNANTAGMQSLTSAGVWNGRTLTAGAGISIANGDGVSGNPTISATGGGSAFTDETADFTIAVDNGYTMNKAGTACVGTLPGTAAYGSLVQIVGKGATGWVVAQPAGVTVHFGSSDTTTGAGGSLSSTNQYDSVVLRCTVADTDWTVQSSVGNITVV